MPKTHGWVFCKAIPRTRDLGFRRLHPSRPSYCSAREGCLLELPLCDKVAHDFVEKTLFRPALLPPVFGIIVRVTRAGHSNHCAVRKSLPKNILGSARMIIRRHHDYAFPIL